jgi:arylsulfatase A-like enzyme
MLENMDSNIGRLRAYLQELGEDENTVYVFMSDNGADNNEQDKIFPEYYKKNFDLSYERMGLKGSYANYGPGWASASGAPLTGFKASASEGGMRVPFIIHYPKRLQKAVTTAAFAYVTDITPTLLDLAGVALPQDTYAGRKVYPPMGKSMRPLLEGKEPRVHGANDVAAYELAGSAAIFRGDYKLLKNNPPYGDRTWRLYNIVEDPVEANDLSKKKPELYQEMLEAYATYAKEVNLIEVPADYDVLEQLQKNVDRNNVKEKTDKVPQLD